MLTLIGFDNRNHLTKDEEIVRVDCIIQRQVTQGLNTLSRDEFCCFSGQNYAKIITKNSTFTHTQHVRVTLKGRYRLKCQPPSPPITHRRRSTSGLRGVDGWYLRLKGTRQMNFIARKPNQNIVFVKFFFSARYSQNLKKKVSIHFHPHHL